MEWHVKLLNRTAFKTLRPSGCTVECGACGRFRNINAIACEHPEKMTHEPQSTIRSLPGAPGSNEQRATGKPIFGCGG